VLRLSTKPGVKVNNLNERWNLSEQDKHERARKCAAFDNDDKGLNAIAVSKEPVVSPDRFRSTRQERSHRCVHLISFAMISDASASERRSPGAGPRSRVRVSDIIVTVGVHIWALIMRLQTRVI